VGAAYIVVQAKQIRAHLPPHVEQQRIVIAARWTLRTVLLPLIAAYGKPTHKDMWDDWLQ
jgi:hypothetical protein